MLLKSIKQSIDIKYLSLIFTAMNYYGEIVWKWIVSDNEFLATNSELWIFDYELLGYPSIHPSIQPTDRFHF